MPRKNSKKGKVSNRARRKVAPGRLRFEYVDPRTLDDNPQNWKTHPAEQMAAIEGVLKDPEVGWAGVLLYNERTRRLIDGHGRKEKAIQLGEQAVPVVFGSWSETAEKKILATLDPIGSMAETNAEALEALRGQLEEQLSGDAFAGLQSQLDEQLAALGDEGEETPVADAPGDGEEANPQAGGGSDGGGYEATRMIIVKCLDEGHQTEILDALDNQQPERLMELLTREGVECTPRNG